MNILIYLGHPAHFHLFKNTIKQLEDRGHILSVLSKKKDILDDLLAKSGIRYLNIMPEGRKDNKISIALGVLKRGWKLFTYCLSNRQDILVGTSAEIGFVGFILRIPSINVNEDDADVVPLYSKISYPWCTKILSPRVCNNGKWEKKSIKYEGYHELAYLHPDNFKPLLEVVKKYLDPDKPYFLVRFAKLNAHHDFGIDGITDSLATKLIDLLKLYGKVYITSERVFDKEFEPYRLSIDPVDIHHIMAFASICIGDSQTMAAESGVLGVPFIRYNSFVGRIGYLRELEDHYQLGFGIEPENPQKMMTTINELLKMKNRGKVFQERRRVMLKEKVNVAEYMTDLIESYKKRL